MNYCPIAEDAVPWQMTWGREKDGEPIYRLTTGWCIGRYVAINCRWSIGQVSVKRRSSVGQASVRRRAGVGQASGRRRSGVGQASVRRRSSVGQVSAKYRFTYRPYHSEENRLRKSVRFFRYMFWFGDEKIHCKVGHSCVINVVP